MGIKVTDGDGKNDRVMLIVLVFLDVMRLLIYIHYVNEVTHIYTLC